MTVWRVVLTPGGWCVSMLRFVRPSKSSPAGYPKEVTAPGSPFATKAAAIDVAERLNAAVRAKRRGPSGGR